MPKKKTKMHLNSIETKKREYLKTFAEIGKTEHNGRPLSDMQFRELDELYKYGVRA